MSVLEKATNILRRAEQATDPVWERHIKWELYVRAALWLAVAIATELVYVRIALREQLRGVQDE